MTMRIEVANLTLTYGDVTALDDMTFALEGGKIHGLLGRNGSGKSSLLSVMAAFRKANSGEVRIDGQPVFENPAVTSRIALIREGGDTVEDSEKASEALRWAAYLRPNWDADYAAQLIERFQVPMDKSLGEMSRGQRSALGIVLGMASRAPLTMFDETYLGLDAPSRYAFYDEILNDYMANPRTFVVSTHLIEEVSSIFEEVLIIDKGRLLRHEETESLLSRGVAVTGAADAVDRFARGLTVIGQRQLGRTKSTMVYGQVDDRQRLEARAAGLELEPIALQDLFVHLTDPEGDRP
jgi:ABC-2 type transport system ATP-binding protein